jgi:hypothetical protein
LSVLQDKLRRARSAEHVVEQIEALLSQPDQQVPPSQSADLAPVQITELDGGTLRVSPLVLKLNMSFHSDSVQEHSKHLLQQLAESMQFSQLCVRCF